MNIDGFIEQVGKAAIIFGVGDFGLFIIHAIMVICTISGIFSLIGIVRSYIDNDFEEAGMIILFLGSMFGIFLLPFILIPMIWIVKSYTLISIVVLTILLSIRLIRIW